MTTTTSSRKEDMVARRQSGETLTSIARSYGITYERVRQIVGETVFERTCSVCGNAFTTTRAKKLRCGDCHCRTCGARLGPQVKHPYCCAEHDPKSRQSAAGATYRVIERGIYIRVYLESFVRVNELFYVHSARDETLHSFSTLEKARAFRDSAKRRTPESAKVRKAILAALARGPARTDQLAEQTGIDARTLGLYLRHMRGDGVVRSTREEQVKLANYQKVMRPVWEIVT